MWRYPLWRQRKYLLAWVSLRRVSYCCIQHSVSARTFGLGIHMAVLCMASMQVLLAWVLARRLSYGSTQYGVRVSIFGLGLLASVIVWLYSAWRQREYLWPE